MLTEGNAKQIAVETLAEQAFPQQAFPQQALPQSPAAHVSSRFQEIFRAVLASPHHSDNSGWSSGQAVDAFDFSRQMGQLKVSLDYANSVGGRQRQG